jgi:hypothetical protein
MRGRKQMDSGRFAGCLLALGLALAAMTAVCYWFFSRVLEF